MRAFESALFDGWGVVLKNDLPFSAQFAAQQEIDPQDITEFILNPDEYMAALAGKRELSEVVAPHLKQWHWEGSAEELIQHWCKLENHPDRFLLAGIRRMRNTGVKCYLAANQTREQADYMNNGPLKDVFDGSFPSYELQAVKPDKAYFEQVAGKLAIAGIDPHKTAFFDDSFSNTNAASTYFHSYLYESPLQALAICGFFS